MSYLWKADKKVKNLNISETISPDLEYYLTAEKNTYYSFSEKFIFLLLNIFTVT